MTSLRTRLGAVRYLADRILHPARHRRARARLAGRPITHALFICHGNINRSAYAAAAFARAIQASHAETVTIRSAGFVGPGRPASELARAVAAERGIDLSDHVSRRLTAADVAAADLIFVMDADQRRKVRDLASGSTGEVLILGDLDPVIVSRRAVFDPYGHPRAAFEHVFDRIDRCIAVLAASALHGHP